MNCFECAKTGETAAAVAICQHCGVGLCFDHLISAERFSVGGTHEGCGHEIPRMPTVGSARTKEREAVAIS